MQRIHPITTISSLSQRISNLSADTWLFVDLDETLLYQGINKYQDQPHIAEPALVAEIGRLRERGIKVFGLTARKYEFIDATRQQMSALGICLDDIIHAPAAVEENNNKQCCKGAALSEYLELHPDHANTIIIADNELLQLENIQETLGRLAVNLHLWHYAPPHHLPIASDTCDAEPFPLNLDGFRKKQNLGGGTNSVFLLEHAESGRQLVLKCGAHEDAAKIEILCNIVYRVLGVKVPDMKIYHELPVSLASDLNLKSTNGIFKVSVKIPADEHQDENLIRTTASESFAAHVLLGNIDVPKLDNFIVDSAKDAYLIDAGANYLYRAKGSNRDEPGKLAMEIESLRDARINPMGHVWFGALTDEQIAAQVAAISAKNKEIEHAVWNACSHLDMPPHLFNAFIDYLSDRMDHLVMRFGRGSQCFAKVDKKAHPGHTSAGILTYTMIDNEPHVLLSQRARHDWWDNFGGKSEEQDVYLSDTARREVTEESSAMLNYTSREIIASPFHDMVTHQSREQQLYRMYIIPYHEIDLHRLTEAEHTQHCYVPLRNVLAALDSTQRINLENCETINVQCADKMLPLFPPLFNMLRQPQVQDNLRELMRSARLKRTRTLSNAEEDIKQPVFTTYRPLVTPGRKRQEIAEAIKNKSALLRDFKRSRDQRDHINGEADELPNQTPAKKNKDYLAQSEIHLKTVLGADYQDDALPENIRKFIEKHTNIQSADEREKLARYALTMIEQEKSGDSNQFYFYHACNNEVTLLYDVYSRLYQILHADDRWVAFRPDSEHFRKFANITEFVAFYSQNGRQTINNFAQSFHDCAISSNVFLFGNHEIPTSNSVNYLMTNDVRRKIDMTALFATILQPFPVTPQEIQRLVSIFDKCNAGRGGSLYQIGMTVEQAQRMAYPSSIQGTMYAWNDSRDLPEIINSLRSADLAQQQTSNYIRTLQARLMVPPNLPASVTSIKWQNPDEQADAVYQQHVEQAVNFILDIFLHYQSKNHCLNSSAPLLRVLPSIHEANQLPLPLKTTEAELIYALRVNDKESVRSILHIHPEYKKRVISLTPQEYIQGGNFSRKEESGTPLMIMINNLPLYIKVILECYGEDWVRQLEGYAIPIDSDKKLHQILSLVPDKYRCEIYMRCAFTIGVDAEAMYETLSDLLPAHELQIMAAQATSLHHAIRILAKPDRLDYVVKYIQKLGENTLSSTDIVMIVKYLPLNDMLIFCRQNLAGCITNWTILADIVTRLPLDIRYEFSLDILQKQQLSNPQHMPRVLAALPADKKLKFTADNLNIIDSEQMLFSVINLLPKESRASLVKDRANIITSSSLLKMILMLLPNNSHEVIKSCKELVKDNDQLLEVLNFLPPESRLEYASACHEHIKDAEDLADVMVMLEDKDTQAFALNHWQLIQSASDLSSIVAMLLPEQKVQMIQSYYELIKTNEEMLDILRHINGLQINSLELFFLQEKKLDLHLAFLEATPDKKQFIETYLHELLKVTNGIILTRCLPIEERSAFVMKEHNKIITNYLTLKQVLELHLRPEQRFAIAVQHLDCISAERLPKILLLLPQEEEQQLSVAWERSRKSIYSSILFQPEFTQRARPADSEPRGKRGLC